MTQKYFDNHNIDLDIKKLISTGNLVLKEKNEKQKVAYAIKDGSSKYDEDTKKIEATVILENTCLDWLVAIHELTHNRNQPLGERNLTSDLLTESLSYVNEFIASQELLDEDYKKIYLIGIAKLIFWHAYELHDIYRVILTYKHQQDITEEAYNKTFKQKDYKRIMDAFDNYLERKPSIFKDSYYILSFALAVYMFDEYNKDNKFYDKIEILNNKINIASLAECLEIIGIKNKEDFKDKIENSSNNLMNYLCDKKKENKKSR